MSEVPVVGAAVLAAVAVIAVPGDARNVPVQVGATDEGTRPMTMLSMMMMKMKEPAH